MSEQRKPQAILRDAKVAVYDDGSISFVFLHDQHAWGITFPPNMCGDMARKLADAMTTWPDRTMCARCGALIVADHAYPWRGAEYCRPCAKAIADDPVPLAQRPDGWQCRPEAPPQAGPAQGRASAGQGGRE